jgi:hypothetical protein
VKDFEYLVAQDVLERRGLEIWLALEDLLEDRP